MPTQVLIADLMASSGVGFGTSGARGLVSDMSDSLCYAYTAAFLQHLQGQDSIRPGQHLGIGVDLRPSSERIANACALAALDLGYIPRFWGVLPTPALALAGLEAAIPCLMVTGSHIPDNRNGIKFYHPGGEILKADEEGIRRQSIRLPDPLLASGDQESTPWVLPPPESQAGEAYLERYLRCFPPACLRNLRLGVYEHSSAVRDILPLLLGQLGAKVTRLGRADHFIAVDTEAIRPEDIELARGWSQAYRLDAILSTDGDGDRPLVSDEQGEWLRGDILGILCARFLDADLVVTPVSSNTAVERCGWFGSVVRTRIGSPYVIQAMMEGVKTGYSKVVGYEANGGFLTATDIELGGHPFPALPTRDALLPILAVLSLAAGQGHPISRLVSQLPQRFTASDRLKDFPTEISRQRLAAFDSGDSTRDWANIETIFSPGFGALAGLDRTDGLRLSFASGEIVHLRPSGNAPEFRVYTEAEDPERAREINRRCLELLRTWKD